MRVVLTDDVTDDAGGLLVGLVPVVAELVHGEQHAAVHRLEAIAHVRQGPANDHAHGVVEVGLLQLVFNIDRGDFFGEIRHCSSDSPEQPRPWRPESAESYHTERCVGGLVSAGL